MFLWFVLHTGVLRPLAPAYLTTILELLLTHLVSLSQPHTAASTRALCAALEEGHEVAREVTMQVMGWFGHIDADENLWDMDVRAVVREVGLGILRTYGRGGGGADDGEDSLSLEQFTERWKTAVGDTFEAEVALDLLAVSHPLCLHSDQRSLSACISQSKGQLPPLDLRCHHPLAH